ncbi:MAG: discoidin domain-containing protein [Armatimonadota bacterium]
MQTNLVLYALPTNLAATATATASSDSGAVDPDTLEPTQDASKAIDGNLATRWQAMGGVDENLTLEWEKPQTFNRVAIKEFSDTIRAYALQRFDEARGDFVDIVVRQVARMGGDPLLSVAPPAPVTTKALRIVVTDFSPSPTLSVVSISEVWSWPRLAR